MFDEGSTIYLQIPAGATALPLRPATVTRAGTARCTVRLEHRDVPAEGGLEVTIFRTVDGRFTRQSARIDGVLSEQPLPAGKSIVVALQTTAPATSAEQRSSFRVATASSGLTAHIAGEPGCRLLDLSATGFAVMSSVDHPVGSTVRARLHLDGQIFEGDATVQSVRVLGPGRIRYGLACVEERSETGTLSRGLQFMTTAIQREQLRRRTRIRRAE